MIVRFVLLVLCLLLHAHHRTGQPPCSPSSPKFQLRALWWYPTTLREAVLSVRSNLQHDFFPYATQSTSNFFLPGCIPSLEILNPRNWTSVMRNLHLDNLTVSPVCRSASNMLRICSKCSSYSLRCSMWERLLLINSLFPCMDKGGAIV